MGLDMCALLQDKLDLFGVITRELVVLRAHVASLGHRVRIVIGDDKLVVVAIQTRLLAHHIEQLVQAYVGSDANHGLLIEGQAHLNSRLKLEWLIIISTVSVQAVRFGLAADH